MSSQQPSGKQRMVSVDVDEFVRTRDALSSAYMGLSSAIDRAVKAYIEHTNTVLAGDATLNVSYLTQPFGSTLAPQAGAAGLTNYGLPQYMQPPPSVDPATAAAGNVAAGAAVPGADAELIGKDGKKKRNYKPRDPNAPKRPLTAYFRYLQKARGTIANEVEKDGIPRTPGDISKIATDRWNLMDEKARKPYQDEYKRELEQHVKDMEAYKAGGGDVSEASLKKLKDTASKGITALDGPEDIVPEAPVVSAAVVTAAGGDAASSSSDSSDDEAKAAKVPTPPPAKKTKKGAKAATTPAAPAPPSPSATRTSPERKRKAAAVEDTADGTKKKRGRKSNADKAAVTDTPSAQLEAETVAAPASEKKKKDKKKKKGDA